MENLYFTLGHVEMTIKTRKHATILYTLSKMVKAVNKNPNIMAISWIGDDDRTFMHECVIPSLSIISKKGNHEKP